MIDRWASVFFVGLETGMRLWRNSRVVKSAAFVTAIGKRAGHTNGAECVEPIGVLDAAAFDRAHRCFHARAFERHTGNDVGNMDDDRLRHVERTQPVAGGSRAGVMVAASE